jgi:molybdate transport system ATP-binding protein
MAMISEQRHTTVPARAPLSDHPREHMLSVAFIKRLPGFLLEMSFAVSNGLTVLFGPSGAGKSLTLQALAGLINLDRAHITFDGTTWHDSASGLVVPPQARRIGYVPQQYALFPHLTVEQNIGFGVLASREEKRRYVAELVSLVQLQGVERLRPAQLSGGQQQRVALARALAVQPRLLLLDEPFSSLDVPVREMLREELRTLQRQIGIPVIMVTHDVQEASALADTMIVVSGGRVLQVGAPETVFRAPRTRAVARLVGMDTYWQGRVLAGETSAGNSPHALVVIQTDIGVLYAYAPQDFMLAREQHIEVGIRTDEIRLHGGDVDDTGLLPALSLIGSIVRTQPRRIMQIVTVRLTENVQLDIPMMRREWRELGLETGSQVTVQLPPGAIHIFASAAE